MANRTKHGQAQKTSEYKTWATMKERCYNKNCPSYKRYGGRGIVVCDRWVNSFENFFDDMGKKPTANHSLDREDVNGNYEKENCRWATKQEQGRNTSRNVYIDHAGRRMILAEWARELGTGYNNITVMLKKKSMSEVVDFYREKNNFGNSANSLAEISKYLVF